MSAVLAEHLTSADHGTCPSWCTLPPGHDASDLERIHLGPTFGPFRTIATTLHPDDVEGPCPFAPPVVWLDEHWLPSAMSSGDSVEFATWQAAADFATSASRAASWLHGALHEHDLMKGPHNVRALGGEQPLGAAQ